MPAHRPPSAGNLSAAPRGRLRGEDLIADLFEAMHDLHFVRDAIEGGEFCLALAMEKLPSQRRHRAPVRHRQARVPRHEHARRGHEQALLMRRHPENEPLLLAAMNKRRAIVHRRRAAVAKPPTLERYDASAAPAA